MSPAPAKEPSRLVSLDAFRGATIALMVLVNNAGSGHDAYFQLDHAAWHGWTITDTVFPSFLWIVGVAITLSLGKRLAAGVPKSKLLLQAVRRVEMNLARDEDRARQYPDSTRGRRRTGASSSAGWALRGRGTAG